MALTLNNLPPKFYPFLLGHPLCTGPNVKEFEKEIETSPFTLTTNGKKLIKLGNNWILKYAR